jgi:hypothetical protein
MKLSERIVLVYVASVAASAGVSYYRGRRGNELLLDTALHGAIAGTAINLAAQAFVPADGESMALFNPLLSGLSMLKSNSGMGKMGQRAIDLLSHIDDTLYDDFKANGVKVGPIPNNPSMVQQDAN